MPNADRGVAVLICLLITLKAEAVCFPVKVGNYLKITWRHKPQDHGLFHAVRTSNDRQTVM
jgi:hypothetical protein